MSLRLAFAALLLIPPLGTFAPVPMPRVDASDAAFVTRNGVVALHDVPFNGVVAQRDSSGAQSETPYRNGRRDGTARAWYANGQLMYERKYRAGRESGMHRAWWSNGTVHFRYRYSNGKSEGLAQEWFPDGRLYRRFNYRDGQEEGQQQMWFADGTLRANYVVRNGRRFGLPGMKGCTGSDSTGVTS